MDGSSPGSWLYWTRALRSRFSISCPSLGTFGCITLPFRGCSGCSHLVSSNQTRMVAASTPEARILSRTKGRNVEAFVQPLMYDNAESGFDSWLGSADDTVVGPVVRVHASRSLDTSEILVRRCRYLRCVFILDHAGSSESSLPIVSMPFPVVCTSRHWENDCSCGDVSSTLAAAAARVQLVMISTSTRGPYGFAVCGWGSPDDAAGCP